MGEWPLGALSLRASELFEKRYELPFFFIGQVQTEIVAVIGSVASQQLVEPGYVSTGEEMPSAGDSAQRGVLHETGSPIRAVCNGEIALYAFNCYQRTGESVAAMAAGIHAGRELSGGNGAAIQKAI